jgi:hypothetical protein
LTKQAQADHGDDIAELHIGVARAVKRYGSESSEGSFVKADGLRRNARDEKARDAGELGVHGVTGAGACHAISGVDIGNAFAHGNDSSGAAVAQGAGLIETAAHGGYGCEQAITADLGQDLANKIGPHSRFLQQVLAGKF